MRGRSTLAVFLLAGLLLLAAVGPAIAQSADPHSPAAPAAPTGTAFTYQGQLKRDGQAVNATCQMEFRLYDAATAGSVVAGPVTEAVAVGDGLFTVKLDFGAAFHGDARWLGIHVQCPGDAAYVDLGRQPLTAAPYALYALKAPWSGLTSVPAGFADGTDNDTTYSAGAGLTLTGGAFVLETAYRLPQACANGQIAEWNGSAWLCGNDDTGSGGGGDITAVNAGAGLTGGGVTGDVTLAASYGGSGSATTLARSDHNHWGQSWSGSDTGLTLSGGAIGLSGSGSSTGVQGYGLSAVGTGVFGSGYIGVQGSSSSTSGRGIVGDATAGSGQTYGVYGQSASPTGLGVYGQALAASGENYGVAGYSPSTSGRGVYGWAGAASGSTYGVLGQSSSIDGTGVRGSATAASGLTTGVMGESSSPAGVGVHGLTSAATGLNAGVFGESRSTTGQGVYALASAATGPTYGVAARSASTSGTGVYGAANASSGETYGVYGRSDSTSGTGVFGWAAAVSGTTYGVSGRSHSVSGIGVYGWADNTTVPAWTTGVYGQSSSVTGTGVYGSGGYKGVVGATSRSTGSAYGVWGESSSDLGVGVMGTGRRVGVYGIRQSDCASTVCAGVYGRGSPYGVLGASDSTSGTGVYGVATTGSGTTYGVRGEISSTLGTAVYGLANAVSGGTTGVEGLSASTSGRGVVGNATATTGTTYGVIGYSASAGGYAGYFRNTSSGPALWALTDSGTGNIIEARSSFSDMEFRVARDGNVYADGAFTGGGADYAELLPGAPGLEPGDVLVIDAEGRLARSNEPYQASVAGVYSTRPGFLAGGGDEGIDLSGQVPLAVMGVVPVKASAENGPIRPGDLLTGAGTPGHAMRAGADPPPGTVIGKALQSLAAGRGVIEMLVMLR
jgi:hypothetical protein